MVLFQPSGPATVWDLSYYFGSGKPAEIVLWVVAIIAIFFALFLLSSHLNTRKPEHLYWGLSFALIWITTHLTIFSGSYLTLFDPVPATFAALSTGLFAVGLAKAVKPENEFLGKFLLYWVLIVSILVGVFKLENLQAAIPFWEFLVPVAVVAVHVPAAVFIIILPIQARSENGNGAIVMMLGGIVMSVVGVLLALVTVVSAALPILASEFFVGMVLRYFPFIYLVAILCFAWGTFVPKGWGFAIPGIELE